MVNCGRLITDRDKEWKNIPRKLLQSNAPFPFVLGTYRDITRDATAPELVVELRQAFWPQGPGDEALMVGSIQAEASPEPADCSKTTANDMPPGLASARAGQRVLPAPLVLETRGNKAHGSTDEHGREVRPEDSGEGKNTADSIQTAGPSPEFRQPADCNKPTTDDVDVGSSLAPVQVEASPVYVFLCDLYRGGSTAGFLRRLQSFGHKPPYETWWSDEEAIEYQVSLVY